MSLERLEAAVTQLPPADLDAFSRWFEVYLTGVEDRRSERDATAATEDEEGCRFEAEFEAKRIEVLAAALELSEKQRVELVTLLEASLSPASSNLHPAWPAEVRRRMDQIDSGQVQSIPWSEVRRRTQAQLNADRSTDG